jgi:hypothetical protein
MQQELKTKFDGSKSIEKTQVFKTTFAPKLNQT